MLFKDKNTTIETTIPALTPYFIGLVLCAMVGFFMTDNPLLLGVLFVPFLIASTIMDYRVVFRLLLIALPLSAIYRVGSINLNISIPAEPLIGILSMVALVYLVLNDSKGVIRSHPISVVIAFYWLSLCLSLVFSTMPSVSVKATIVATCYILVFYILTIVYLQRSEWQVKKIFFGYILTMTFVVLYATYRHAGYGFNKGVSAYVVEPFLSDHTIYGACLAFCVPIAGVFYWKAKIFKLSTLQKYIVGFAFFAFLAGIYFSHSRATWISLLSILGMLLVVRLKIKFSTLLIVWGIVVFVAMFNLESLMPVLIKNKYDSKAKRANLEEQLKSVANIKNDVSNAERVNRWLCAVRMFKEKPFTGYGVGTYQFKYIPFQKGSEMTSISITSPKNNYHQGMGGTAHSEYLLALSESGVFACLSMVVMAFYSLYLGLKLYYTTEGEYKYYALMVLLGLITYFLHGIFNNFLTTDKAAFLVWGGLATLCALDLRQKSINQTNSK